MGANGSPVFFVFGGQDSHVNREGLWRAGSGCAGRLFDGGKELGLGQPGDSSALVEVGDSRQS